VFKCKSVRPIPSGWSICRISTLPDWMRSSSLSKALPMDGTDFMIMAGRDGILSSLSAILVVEGAAASSRRGQSKKAQGRESDDASSNSFPACASLPTLSSKRMDMRILASCLAQKCTKKERITAMYEYLATHVRARSDHGSRCCHFPLEIIMKRSQGCEVRR
jgi:hypothetical protein